MLKSNNKYTGWHAFNNLPLIKTFYINVQSVCLHYKKITQKNKYRGYFIPGGV